MCDVTVICPECPPSLKHDVFPRSQARGKFFTAWLLSDKDGGGKAFSVFKIQGLFIVPFVVWGSFSGL